jgi:hypothetical protein
LFNGVYAIALLVAAVPPSRLAAADEPRVPKALPADLEAVPPDALGFISIRPADLWDSEISRAIRAALRSRDPETDQAALAELDRAEAFYGVRLETAERFTAVLLDPADNAMVFIISTLRPYDRDRLIKRLTPEAKEFRSEGRTYFAGTKSGGKALHFLSDRSYVVGNEPALNRLFEHWARKQADGPLGTPRGLAAQKHLLVASWNTPRIATVLRGQPLPREAEPFRPMLSVRSASLTGDLTRELRLDLRLDFPGMEEAREGEKAVQAGLDLAQQFLDQGLRDLARNPTREQMGPFRRVVEQVQASVKAASVRGQGSLVGVTVRTKLETDAVVNAAVVVREVAQRSASFNNLKQIGIAMHNYHDTYLAFPTAAIYSKDGKPLLSWRVAILPYIEEQPLYNEFHLDEPWDSAHNKKLLDRMPRIYRHPRARPKDAHSTYYQVFTGKGAVFEGKKGLNLGQLTNGDGTTYTLLVVEGAEGVPWTKPADLVFDPDKPLPRVGGHFRGASPFLFADGSVRSLPDRIKEKTLRALITWNGAEVIDPKDLGE